MKPNWMAWDRMMRGISPMEVSPVLHSKAMAPITPTITFTIMIKRIGISNDRKLCIVLQLVVSLLTIFSD